MAIVLHQLTANGAKYGAFFYRNGRVLLRWRWLRNGSVERPAPLREIGSPRVLRPRQRGYGTDVIHELIPFELGGSVDLTFAADGLKCRVELSSHWAGTASSPKGQELLAASAGPST